MSDIPLQTKSIQAWKIFRWFAGIHILFLVIPLGIPSFIVYYLTGLPGTILGIFGVKVIEGELFGGPTTPAVICGYVIWLVVYWLACLKFANLKPQSDPQPKPQPQIQNDEQEPQSTSLPEQKNSITSLREKLKYSSKIFVWLAGIHFFILLIPSPFTFVLAMFLSDCSASIMKILGFQIKEGRLISEQSSDIVIISLLIWYVFYGVIAVAIPMIFPGKPIAKPTPSQKGVE